MAPPLPVALLKVKLEYNTDARSPPMSTAPPTPEVARLYDTLQLDI